MTQIDQDTSYWLLMFPAIVIMLNTVFVSAVTAYFVTNPPTSPGQAEQTLPLAFIHGYHVAFFWGAALFACALIASIVLINAHKEDIPAESVALGEPVD